MRKSAIPISILLLFLATALDVHAATLAGVTLSDNAQVAGKTLVLNGLGVRKKFVVKVYVAGLYLEQKSSDPGAIIKADAPKRIVLHFVHGASKKQMTDAFDESFINNTPDAKMTMQADIAQFLGALEDVKDGDQLVFTYLPGTGTTVAINGNDKLTIADAAFAPVLFSVWLGPKPPNADLKKGILGQQ